MSTRRKGRNAVRNGSRPAEAELRIATAADQVCFRMPTLGFDLKLEQSDVVGAIFVEESESLEISLLRGSVITLQCSLDDAMSLAVRLLPEERDGEFLYQAKDGARYCAWDDLR